jgi:hypothetical protein
MNQLLQIFKHRLIDFSSTNKALFLGRLTKSKFIDVMDFDFKTKDSGLELIKKIFSDKAEIKIIDASFHHQQTWDELISSIQFINKTRKLILEETGSVDFYCAWPFIEGRSRGGQVVKAPLFFIPCQLQVKNKEVFVVKKEHASMFLNKTLLLALSQYESLTFSHELYENTIPFFKDSTTEDFRVQILRYLQEQHVPISNSRDFLKDNLIHYTARSKNDMEESYSFGQYELKPQAVFGFFPLSSTYMHFDYEQLEQRYAHLDLEKELSNALQWEVKNPKNLVLPFQVDGSQELIIQKMAQGKSLVVEGPPGSGKTQLISNLTAHYLSQGKKVLVVCQKKAALDVVYQRLSQAQIAQFCSLVHDVESDRSLVFSKIETQIESIQTYRSVNNHPSSIVFENEFSKVQIQINQLVNYFDKYKQALYDINVGGETAHDLYLKIDRTITPVDLGVEFKSINLTEVPVLKYAFQNYISLRHAMSDHAKFLFKLNELHTQNFKAQWNSFLLQHHEAYTSYDKRRINVELKDVDLFLVKIKEWFNATMLAKHRLTGPDLQELKKINVEQSIKFIHQLQYQQVLPTTHELLEWRKQLHQLQSSFVRRTLFVVLGRFTHGSLYTWLQQQFISSFEQALELIAKAITLNESIHRLQEYQILANTYSIQELEKAFQQIPGMLQNEKDLFEIAALEECFNRHDFYEVINVEVNVFDNIQSVIKLLSNHLPLNEVIALFLDASYRANSNYAVENFWNEYEQYLNLKQQVGVETTQTFYKVYQLHAQHSSPEIVRLWEQALLCAWLKEKELVFPILKEVDSLAWQNQEQTLQALVQQRTVMSVQFAQIKLRELVYADLEYNRLNRQVTYRDLLHQVTKKRSRWPLRKLVQEHEEEILSLLPCWLASPETVSVVFPMKQVFDLIIYDEASQCFVEKALPSMFKAKQVLVIGDSKQLQPSDLYKVKYDVVVQEENLDLETQSLLDFSSRYFGKEMLKGHYRSKSEALIRFSNQHFYQNKLNIIPDLAYQHQTCLKYIFVKGVWENNMNVVEANKVIALMQEIWNIDPLKQIGVIAFNYIQASYIQSLVDGINEIQHRKYFVKNIENVQGDECDVLLFSVAYAKDKQGKMVVQFGSLMQEGGENRLNVAITRAREQVMLVASIMPDDIQVEKYKNDGVKLLKAYLQFVYAFDQQQQSIEMQKQEKVEANTLSLKHKLLEMNHAYTTSYIADLTDRVNPSQLFFTEDELYYYSPTSSDWHAYRPNLLRSKGWELTYLYTKKP